MLEFYQAYTDYRGVMDLTQELIEQAAKEVNGATKSSGERIEIDWAGSNWRRLTMREAIIQFWPEAAGAKPANDGFRLARGSERIGEALQSPASHIAYDPKTRWKNNRGLFEARRRTSDSADDHLRVPYRRFAASKQKADEPDWTERWEIFAGKMEIANGFSELNDPEDQRRRFEQQLEGARARRRRSPPDGRGLHPRALVWHAARGRVGVGVDRLAMLLTIPTPSAT